MFKSLIKNYISLVNNNEGRKNDEEVENNEKGFKQFIIIDIYSSFFLNWIKLDAWLLI